MKRIVLSVCAAVAFVTVAMGAASDYQQVEYLGLTGKQYFTVPFKRTTENLGYSIKFRLASIETYGPHIISTGGASPGYWVVCRRDGGGGLWAVYESGSCLGLGPEYYPGGSLNASIGKDFAMAFNTNGTQRLEINGVEVAERTNIPKPSSLTELQLCHHDGQLQLNGRFYGVQFFVAGEMVADYRTCYRLVDNAPGLYETFTDTFHANKGTDTAKITLGPEVGVRTDALTISARPGVVYGACDPAYGMIEGLAAGDERTLTASQVVTNGDDTVRDYLTGWELCKRISGGVMEPIDNGTESSVTYCHPAPAASTRFDWIWRREFRVFTSAGEFVRLLTAEDQWVVEGDTATISAAVPGPRCMVRWGGDVPRAQAFDNPLELVTDASKRVTSEAVGWGAALGSNLTKSWQTIATGVKSLDGCRISGVLNGGFVYPQEVCDACRVQYGRTDSTQTVNFQFQVVQGGGGQFAMKCVIAEMQLLEDGTLQVRATSASYQQPASNKPGEVDAATFKEQTLATSDSANGYGIKELLVYVPLRKGFMVLVK